MGAGERGSVGAAVHGSRGAWERTTERTRPSFRKSRHSRDYPESREVTGTETRCMGAGERGSMGEGQLRIED